MASQRLFIASLAGEAAAVAADLFASWRKETPAPDAAVVDRFCQSLRDNCSSPPVLYFSEWVDHWSMGDLFPGPGVIITPRFEAACFLPGAAADWAGECGDSYEEQEWLSARLREASAAWGSLTDEIVVVVVREVFGASATDEQIRASLGTAPTWLLDVVQTKRGAIA